MSASAIEIRWGSGFETSESRSSAREHLRDAADLVTGYAGDQGFDLQGKYKIVAHSDTWEGAERRPLGEAVGAQTIHLNVRPNLWKRPYMQTVFLGCTMLHELVHCLRLRHYPTVDNLVEMAATEGIAYNAERQFRVQATPWDRAKGNVAKIGEIDDATMRSIREPFMQQFASGQTWDEESQAEWYLKPYWGLFGKAEVIGIHTVRKKVLAGEELAPLIYLPAAEVLMSRRAPEINTVRIKR